MLTVVTRKSDNEIIRVLLLKGILLLPVELNLLYYNSSYFSPKLLFFCSSILIALIGVPVNA